jgi:hypothetical protein
LCRKERLDWRKDLSLIYIGLSEVMLKVFSPAPSTVRHLRCRRVFAEDFGFYPLFNFISEVGALQGGVAANSAFLNGRRETAHRFIDATVRGLKYFKSERSGTVKIMTKYMNPAPIRRTSLRRKHAELRRGRDDFGRLSGARSRF